MTNRVNLTPEQIRVTEIALRTLTGRDVNDADKQYAASHLAAISATWSTLSALRNYHHSTGYYDRDTFEQDGESSALDAAWNGCDNCDMPNGRHAVGCPLQFTGGRFSD